MALLAEARALTKSFGDVTAVDRVDLTVARGEVVGLLGANGAGKTTLIRMLLGLLRPTGGQVGLFGSNPSMTTRRRVGYVPQTLGLYDDMTVQENWAFSAAAYGLTRPALPESLTDLRGELVSDLSLGLQRMVAFDVAFSHRPELLILDEPTSGVGPLSGAQLWDAIRGSAESGSGALVTTHNMEEAEQCDRLVVMVDGRVLAAGTVEEVIGDRRVVQLSCDDWRRAFRYLDADGFIAQVQGDLLRVAGTLEEVQAFLSRHGLTGVATPVPANLEEAFVDVSAGR